MTLQNIKSFDNLGIEINRKFQGRKIEIKRLVDNEIVITYFEIKKSKFCKEGADGNDKEMCLYLQIHYDGEPRVLWGNYKYLIEQARQLKPEDLPFKTTIKNEHGYMFT